MYHNKVYKDKEGKPRAVCNGRVFVDRLYPMDKRIELYCLKCGHRWFIKRDGRGFSNWLARREAMQSALVGISF